MTDTVREWKNHCPLEIMKGVWNIKGHQTLRAEMWYTKWKWTMAVRPNDIPSASWCSQNATNSWIADPTVIFLVENSEPRQKTVKLSSFLQPFPSLGCINHRLLQSDCCLVSLLKLIIFAAMPQNKPSEKNGSTTIRPQIDSKILPMQNALKMQYNSPQNYEVHFLKINAFADVCWIFWTSSLLSPSTSLSCHESYSKFWDINSHGPLVLLYPSTSPFLWLHSRFLYSQSCGIRTIDFSKS